MSVDFDAEDFDASWRPLDIIDLAEDERNAALNEVCMAAIRIVLPDEAQVQLYQDLLKPVPGLNMTTQPMPDMIGVEGAELVTVTWGKWLIVRAVVVSRWGMTGKIPYVHTRIVNLRTILNNFL